MVGGSLAGASSLFMAIVAVAPPIVGDADRSEATSIRALAAPWEGAGRRASTNAPAVDKLSATLRQGIRASDVSTKVWVFFTDKGVATEDAYLAAITEVAEAYDPRALRRRQARRTAPGWFDHRDLPVVADYVDAVTATGAEQSILSRWLNAVSVRASREQIEHIAALPFVRRIKHVRRGIWEDRSIGRAAVRAGGAPARGSFYGYAQPQIEQMNLAALHAMGYTGAGVLIGVLDTGFRRSHAAFNEPGHEIDVVMEWDFVNGDGNTDIEAGDLDDQHEHGTLILGTIGAYKADELVGGAYDASFILAKVEDVGGEYPLEEDWFAAGLEFIESRGGDVATSSVVAYWYPQEAMDGETSVMAQAVNVATANGLHVCQGVGNSGHDDDPTTARLLTPSDAFEVIGCGAVDAAGVIASFSSDGPTQDGRVKPEVLARGQSTWTVSPFSDTAYATASGTSLSTPLVCTTVACLVQAHPNWTVKQMREALFTRADYYVQNQTHDPLYVHGFGIVNAAASAVPPCRDFDGDLDVDLGDLSVFQLCFTGSDPTGDPPLACPRGANADCDGDGDVDWDDFALLYAYFYGPVSQP